MPPEMLLQSLHQRLPGENHSLPVMSPAAADMTVLERQMGRFQWRPQQQRLIESQSRQVQQQPTYFADAIASDTLLIPTPYTLPPHILQAAGLCGEQGMIGVGHGFSGGWAGAWPDVVTHYPFPCNSGPGEDVLGGTGEGALSRSTFGCRPPLMSNVDVEISRGRPASPPASHELEHYASTGVSTTFSTDGARESSKKRKSTERSITTHKVEDDDRAKKMIFKLKNSATPVEPKVESPASTVITTTTNYCKDDNNNNNNRDSSSGASRPEKKRAVEQLPKTDYIHVRARRGQATDSHSLAERVRREKISDRMKLLQGLVPGCNKITGKAGMLDEIINYVQSLQRQVEFLSMKLAAVTPSLDFNLDAWITKELSTLAGGCGVPPPDQMGLLPPELLGLSFLQLFDPLQQQAMAAAAAAAEECHSLPVPILVSSGCNSAQEALRGVAGADPASAAPDSCSFPDPRSTLVHPRPSDQLTTSPGWEGELQSFYTGTMLGFEQGSPAAVPLAAVDAPVAPRSSR